MSSLVFLSVKQHLGSNISAFRVELQYIVSDIPSDNTRVFYGLHYELCKISS